MKCPFVIKVCTKCKRILVANEMNFHKLKGGKWDLNSQCKKCREKYKKEYRKEHKEEIKTYNKMHCGKYREKHKEEIKKYNKQYNIEHKEELYEKKKIYRQTEKGKEVNRKIARKQAHKRRALKRNQTYSYEQLEEMNLFFNNCCAYSGIELTNDNYSIDHIIPLSKGGENLIWNLVPMEIRLNSSKCANDMFEWYQKQEFYSEERLQKIYEWIKYAKYKWGRE